MQHKRILEGESVTNHFSYLAGIVKISIYSEYRGDSAGYKCFVSVYIFGNKVLHWFYRDEYSRSFYYKDRTIDAFEVYKYEKN